MIVPNTSIKKKINKKKNEFLFSRRNSGHDRVQSV